MKKLLFFCDIYWDLHWMYNVIKSLDGEVYSTNSNVSDLCSKLDIKIAPNKAEYHIVVLTNIHLGRHRDMANYYLGTGGSVVIMQHAWDSAIQLQNTFWGHDAGKFTYMFVGSTQDYQWLSGKYGSERIKLTGLPKLDDLYRIKNSTESLQPIYDKLGVDSFYLSIAPTSSICEPIMRAYDDNLEGHSPKRIVFKMHPGSNLEATRNADVARGKEQRILVGDDIFDIDNTYKLIKASSGVVCVESFLSVEASLMGKPVIFHGVESLPNDFYQRSENINQIHRAPKDMSSTLQNPVYTDRQKEIASYYLFDGKNTERVVTELKKLL